MDPATGSAHSLDLGEVLTNSTTFDATGVYPLSVTALYKVPVAPDGSVQIDCRTAYDPGTAAHGLEPGSGTTPTLYGAKDDLIGICDQADCQVNLVVLDRTSGSEICKVPLLHPGESDSENSRRPSRA